MATKKCETCGKEYESEDDDGRSFGTCAKCFAVYLDESRTLFDPKPKGDGDGD